MSKLGRPKVKESKAMTFRLRKDLSDKLGVYSSEYHIPKTVIVERALEAYFETMHKLNE